MGLPNGIEKPNECKQCGKCFVRAGDLKRHENLHTKNRTYNSRDSNEIRPQRFLRKCERIGSSTSSGFTSNTLSLRETVTPGGDSAYERGGDARRKFSIEHLKETDLGVAQAFFNP